MQREISKCFKRVKAVFVWASDMETAGVGEYWSDFAESVKNGSIARADCDDFALTVLELGIEDYGWDREQCQIARVLTEQGAADKPFDHAIAIYEGMIFDNRQRGPVPVGWPSYRYYDYCGIPITEWKLYAGGADFLDTGRW